LDSDIFGAGIYTPRQAARLIKSTPQEVLRWTRGSGTTLALWDGHYQYLDDTTELSFSDLIELRVVRAFRRAGISLQAIRFAIALAKERFGLKDPLSSMEFKTDGREILMAALEHDGELFSLSKKNPGQKVFPEIVAQSLIDLEYEDGKSVRWRPRDARKIVIDPKRLFGSPIIDDFGVQTSTLFEEYKQFNDLKYLSAIYDIPIAVISQAIKFELDLEGGTTE
jgi:uncharacterized protein (DUF433 family)